MREDTIKQKVKERYGKAADHAKQNGYTNVEFKKGDIEKGIPINDLDSIRKAGFSDEEVLEENLYMDNDNIEGRRITCLVINAVKI